VPPATFARVNIALVKSLIFIPFAFIAGDQGFALFAAYAAIVLIVATLFLKPNK